MKKEAWAPLALIGVGLAFAIVSFLVWATRGKNAALIDKKLRVGALLLSLTGAAACGGFGNTCYVQARPEQRMSLHGALDSNGALPVDLSVNNVLAGQVIDRVDTEFSFQITDVGNNVVQEGPIAALDGAFDEETESFEITVSTELAAGSYTVTLLGETSSDEYTLVISE